MSAVSSRGAEGANARPNRLLIVSHVIHYQHDGRLYAYGPYAREIDIWADLFAEVRIAAPCRYEAPPGDALAFSRDNISIVPQLETGGTTFRAKARQIVLLPRLIRDLWRAMRDVDAIHVRCPGNLGLLGAVLAPLRSQLLVAKYSNQWPNFPGEPVTSRVQKVLLRSKWWRGPVTIYGSWPQLPAHVVPFFTSVLTEDQLAIAREAAKRRRSPTVPKVEVLYVGRLSPSKNVDVLISAVARIASKGIPLTCRIVGWGPCGANLQGLVETLGLSETVVFEGAVPLERVLDFYRTADVLVLVSEAEGWPKAIAEGMAFGLVVIGSNRGLVPQMLGDGRGITVPPRDVEALERALADVALHPEKYEEMRIRAGAWGQKCSLEQLRQAIADLLREHWGIEMTSMRRNGRCSE